MSATLALGTWLRDLTRMSLPRTERFLILAPVIALIATLDRVTALGPIFVFVTALRRIFAFVTAFFFSCFAPTLPFGKLTAA